MNTASDKRRLFVGGNWKSNGTLSSVSALVSSLFSLSIPVNTDVCVAPPYIYLQSLLQQLDKTGIKVSAQNCSPYKSGAYTGEVSAEQLKDLGIECCIIGHSERRHVFNTPDDILKKQIQQCLDHRIHIIIYCVGETEQQRKNNETETVLLQQLSVVHSVVSDARTWIQSIVIAYEPVWAIGTGQTATADQAQQAHAFIREWLSTHLSAAASAAVRIIYGGSVTAKNSGELIKEPDIDGFLVGGASLKAAEFAQIVAATDKK